MVEGYELGIKNFDDPGHQANKSSRYDVISEGVNVKNKYFPIVDRGGSEIKSLCLLPTAYSLQSTSYILQPTAQSLQPPASSLQPTAYSLHPDPPAIHIERFITTNTAAMHAPPPMLCLSWGAVKAMCNQQKTP